MPRTPEVADQHFCDTNVVIGYTVLWSNLHNPVSEYFGCLNESCTVHFSERAIDEAQSVIRSHRRFTQQAARLVFEKFEPSDAYSQLEDIKKFVRSELSGGYRGPSDAMIDGVMTFIEHNEWLFDGLSKHENTGQFERELLSLTEEFEKPLELLESLRTTDNAYPRVCVFTPPEDEYACYPEFSVVQPLFTHEPEDLNLLFDAFHFLNRDDCLLVAFVTNDHKDFISNRQKLETELTGVSIYTPTEVVELVRESA